MAWLLTLALILGTAATDLRGQEPPPESAAPAPTDADPAAAPRASTDPLAVDPPAATQDGAGPGQAAGAGRAGAAGGAEPGRGPVVSQAARLFADKLKEAVVLELEAQGYEQSTIGAKALEDLPRGQLERRKRVDQDRAEFQARGGRFSVEPLFIPPTAEGVSLGRDELVFLTTLANAYENSRTPVKLNSFIKANQDFLRTADWSHRDEALLVRETILRREEAWLTLFASARELALQGTAGTPTPELMEVLTKLDPEAVKAQTDPIKLVLELPEARTEALTGLRGYLDELSAEEAPPRTTAELAALVPTLQQQLVDASGLTELLAELSTLDAELAQIDLQLEDQGVAVLPATERKVLSKRKTEIVLRQSRIRHQWMMTVPAPEPADETVQALTELIEGRMLELGSRAALFGHRRDEIDRTFQRDIEIPASTWLYLEAQHELLADLELARPVPGLLAGLKRPPPLIIPAALAKALLTKPGSATNLLRNIPKPVSKKGKGGKKGKKR